MFEREILDRNHVANGISVTHISPGLGATLDQHHTECIRTFPFVISRHDDETLQLIIFVKQIAKA